MHVCPQCNFASIPAWRAFVVISILEKPINCHHCGARLKLRRGALDALAGVPAGVTVVLAMRLEVASTPFVMWALFLATVASLALWGNFVRYKLVEEPIKFTPHPSSPPRS